MTKLFRKLFLFGFFLIAIRVLMQFVLGISVDDFSANLPKLTHIAQHNYNTLFIGNSRTESGINPILFDSLLQSENIKSFNLAMGGFFMPDTEKLLKSALENSKSKIEYIFLELSTPTALHHVQFSPDYQKEDYSFAMQLLSKDFSKFSLEGVSTQSILLQMSARHTKALVPKPENAFYFKQKGFLPLQKVNAEIDDTYNFEVHKNLLKGNDFETSDLVEQYSRRVQNLIAYTQEKGVRLIVFLPYKMTEGEAQILAAVFNQLNDFHKISPEYQPEFPSLFHKTNFADRIHLSEKGAEIYTKIFAEEFGCFLKRENTL